MTTLDAPLYEARNISKSYGSVVALDDVSLFVRAGADLGCRRRAGPA